MKRKLTLLEWAIIVSSTLLVLSIIPAVAQHYQFRPGAGQQLMTLLLLGGLVAGFWWWVREFTHDTLRFRRRKHQWEDDDES